MPAIAVIVAYYRFNEPDGLRLLIDRDHECENLADMMAVARRRIDRGYARYIASGGSQEEAICLLDRQLLAASRLQLADFDASSASYMVGAIDLLERLGVLKRDIYNGVYVSFIDTPQQRE